MSKPKFVVVAGSSAGGLQAFTTLASALVPNDEISWFFLQHASREGIEKLYLDSIQGCTTIPCVVPHNDMPIEAGHIYIARAGYHIIITQQGTIKLTKGAYENRWRPSIDVLFRSAAVAFRENAIGIICSGLLDDGTSGMISIQECGGVTLVQEPVEASFPEMPTAVLNAIQVDYRLPVGQMPVIIDGIVAGKKRKKITPPPEVLAEAAISEKVATGIDVPAAVGKPTPFTCPDCGGALWEIDEKNHHRFRCHTGHSYTESDYDIKQSEKLESALWVALRMMQERLALLKKLQAENETKGMKNIASFQAQRVSELNEHINKIKEIIMD